MRGAVSSGTRSTTERVKAAIFNILQQELYRQGRVLDLFAGSGSLGIEALSRGAAWADFVEHDRRQCQVIKSNLETTGFTSAARVNCIDVDRSLDTLTGPYQLVLLDPPYAMQRLDEVVEKVGTKTGLVAGGGMVIVGHSRFVELKAEYAGLERVSHRRYGDNVVEFYQSEDNEW